jgi:histidinol phosphatase-like enzyme (inositol monophosphatase family)
MDSDGLDEFTDFAARLADAAGTLLRAAHRGAVTGEAKGDGSPVTDVDRAVEDRIRAMIAEIYPDHGVLGEERGASAPGANAGDFVWVIDPIDGTLPFLAGIPVFGTLIALLREGVPLLGVIDMPVTEERWIGVAGAATTRNGAPVSVRPCAELSAALLSTSNPDFYGAADFQALRRLNAATRWTVYGGSCLAYAQLASGRIDLGLDVGLDSFDFLALVPVIAGAGGVITDWQGRPLGLGSGDRILAAGDPCCHARALELLAGP